MTRDELLRRLVALKKLSTPLQSNDLDLLLFHCAVYGEMNGMTTLLDLGVAVNKKDSQGYTPLHRAAHHGHLDVVSLLLDRGANINEENEDGHTPLDSAESTINVQTAGQQKRIARCKVVVAFLLSKEAIRGAPKGRPKPMIHHQSVGSLPWNRRRPVKPKSVPNLFLSPVVAAEEIASPRFDTPRSDDSSTEAAPPPVVAEEVVVDDAAPVEEENIEPTLAALFAAIAKNDAELVARLLKSRIINVNGVDDEGYTPLHRAAENGCAAIASALVAAHADLNALVKNDKGSFTPLDLAALNGHTQTTAMLVAAGAQTHHHGIYLRDIDVLLHPERVEDITTAEIAHRTITLLHEYEVLRNAEAGPFLKWAGLAKTFKPLCSKENKILIAQTCIALLDTHEGIIDGAAILQAIVLPPDSDLQKIDKSKLASAIETIMNDKRLGEIIKAHNKLAQLSVPKARMCGC